MIANALFFTVVILIGYGFWLLDQLKFMARYKTVLFHAYGTTILIFLVVLFVNLFGVALATSAAASSSRIPDANSLISTSNSTRLMQTCPFPETRRISTNVARRLFLRSARRAGHAQSTHACLLTSVQIDTSRRARQWDSCAGSPWPWR